MMRRIAFAVWLTAAISVFALSAPRAQFNGCTAGFCSSVVTAAANYSLALASASSQYLSAVGKVTANQQKFTFACWARLTAFTGANTYTFFTAGDNSANNNVKLTNTNAGNLLIAGRVSAANVMTVQTNSALLTDTNWHFLLWGGDTTQATAANRIAIEFDGTPAALTFTVTPAQNQNLALNLTGNSSIGASLATGPTTPTTPFNGKMAQCYYIDGQKLT